MKLFRIAVIMTCHNRKNTTLECLHGLYLQTGVESIKIEVFLVDDGSTDGTGKAIRKKYPRVRVLEGDGNLYWCGGMRLAFDAALKEEYDFYLWLNDDVELYRFAIERMLQTYLLLLHQLKDDAIVVGSFCDKRTGKITYGGMKICGRWNPAKHNKIQPTQLPQQCDIFNGNCVLIPKNVALRTGNISDAYKHGAGDMDYAARAAECGFSSWICSGYVGTCSRNRRLEQLKNKDLPLKKRIDAFNHPITLMSLVDWLIYLKKYHKFSWYFYNTSFFIKFRFPRLYFILKDLFAI